MEVQRERLLFLLLLWASLSNGMIIRKLECHRRKNILLKAFSVGLTLDTL